MKRRVYFFGNVPGNVPWYVTEYTLHALRFMLHDSMTLKEQILNDLKDALKSGDELKRDTLRFLQSAIKNSEIEKKKKDTGLSDEEIVDVLRKSVKQRNDSIEQYEKGNRPELAEKEKKEMEIIAAYLPAQMSEEEVKKVVLETIAQMNATKKDFGKVMGTLSGKLKGKADGAMIKKIVDGELK